MAGREAAACVPEIRDAIPDILAGYLRFVGKPSPITGVLIPAGATLFVVCTDRPRDEQWGVFIVGREFVDRNGVVIPDPQGLDYSEGRILVRRVNKSKKLTDKDGWKKKSKHNVDAETPLATATDFGVLVNGKYMAGKDDAYLYEPLAELAHEHGLISGGVDFPGKWKDWPHVETQGPLFLKG